MYNIVEVAHVNLDYFLTFKNICKNAQEPNFHIKKIAENCFI